MGRTACTEPQCLYKGALYVAYCDSIGMLLVHVASEGLLCSRNSTRPAIERFTNTMGCAPLNYTMSVVDCID